MPKAKSTGGKGKTPKKELTPAQKEAQEIAAEKEVAEARLRKEEAKAQKDADARNKKMLESAGVKIDVDLLTEPEKGDNENQIALKQSYAKYYDQNPHRRKDNMEKAQLLEKLNDLGEEGSQYINGVVIKAPRE